MVERADSNLVALANSGDKHAFGTLIERYRRLARRAAAGVRSLPW